MDDSKCKSSLVCLYVCTWVNVELKCRREGSFQTCFWCESIWKIERMLWELIYILVVLLHYRQVRRTEDRKISAKYNMLQLSAGYPYAESHFPQGFLVPNQILHRDLLCQITFLQGFLVPNHIPHRDS